jgi:hypothetical protein
MALNVVERVENHHARRDGDAIVDRRATFARATKYG